MTPAQIDVVLRRNSDNWLCKHFGHKWRSLYQWWSNPLRGEDHQQCKRCGLGRMIYIDPKDRP